VCCVSCPYIGQDDSFVVDWVVELPRFITSVVFCIVALAGINTRFDISIDRIRIETICFFNSDFSLIRP